MLQKKVVAGLSSQPKLVSELPEWIDIFKYLNWLRKVSLREIFKVTPSRAESFYYQFGEWQLDISRTKIDKILLGLLMKLARATNVPDKIEAMFSGAKINLSEDRAVLHTALRNISYDGQEITALSPVLVDGVDVMPGIIEVLEKMKAISEELIYGDWRGFTGKQITDVINIGIGGSDLGPRALYSALEDEYHTEGKKVHYVSNVDDAEITKLLAELDPETTMILVASKTFTTPETIQNAKTAREWILSRMKDPKAIARHFVALSTNKEKVTEFGIDPENMFEFWDWVGGRYSSWSAVGLSLAIGLGFDNFMKLLQGAQEMDQHFRTTPLEKNIPVILGMVDILYRNFFAYQVKAFLPYAQNLGLFGAHLQQLIMESNGKRVDLNGNLINYPTEFVVFGQPGTNGQHSFYQELHQGTVPTLMDFIYVVRSPNNLLAHRVNLLANYLGQLEAFMVGRTTEEVAAELQKQGLTEEKINQLLHAKEFEGSKPVNALITESITPRSLGQLLALYEHITAVKGFVWGINSFDQEGVELGKKKGKKIGEEIEKLLAGQEVDLSAHDSSIAHLMQVITGMMKDQSQ
jgi:glucose-6-phosphate isomerase